MPRAAIARAALLLYVMTGIANVLAFGYQFVMPRLLRPAEFAILTQLFGILLLESIGTQVVQTATAKLAAQYRARDDDAALHVFVRRWAKRLFLGAVVPGLLVAAAAPLVGPALALSVFSVALLGVTLFLAIVVTFGLGLLQGLGRFVALGASLIAQAGSRLLLGAALVLAGFGADGAFFGAAIALAIGVAVAFVPLRRLFGAARASTEPHLAPGETRFFVLAGGIVLAYAGLTNVDAVLARPLLSEADAGAYAAAVTLGKIILFAPVAIGFILLERTASAHERGVAAERPLYLALGFVLLTSGAVAVGYALAPAFFTALVVGDQYSAAAAIVPTYGLAALANALLSIWNAYFIGRGHMRIGILLVLALVTEVVLLAVLARDPLTMARIVGAVALVTQTAAALTFVIGRLRERRAARGSRA